MRRRYLTLVAVPAVVAVLVSIAAVEIAGQASSAKKPTAGGPSRASAPSRVASRDEIPRMADGHPDLQGTYDLGTLTPLERVAARRSA
jgi:hypothetical protein